MSSSAEFTILQKKARAFYHLVLGHCWINNGKGKYYPVTFWKCEECGKETFTFGWTDDKKR